MPDRMLFVIFAKTFVNKLVQKRKKKRKNKNIELTSDMLNEATIWIEGLDKIHRPIICLYCLQPH